MSTSPTSGTLRMVLGPSPSIAATMCFDTAFFDPRTRISPRSGPDGSTCQVPAMQITVRANPPTPRRPACWRRTGCCPRSRPRRGGPANILISRFGIVGLADFGLASIVAAGGEQSVTRDALTPAHAPPESFRLEEPTVAADVYSLAATLYALLAGRPPRFPAGPGSPSPAVPLYLHDQPVEDVPGAPPGLLAVLRQCLAADPAARLPGAAALRDTLAALPDEPACPPGAPGPASRPTQPPALDRVRGGPGDTTQGSPPHAVPAGHSRRPAGSAATAPRWQPA